MTDFTSIHGFIESTGAKLRVFDLGRRVQKLSVDWYKRFEAGKEVYPFPFQQQAWLGFLFWDSEQYEEHFIWFVKLPLDETGKLNPGGRDDFMRTLVEKIGDNLSRAEKGEKLQHVLQGNPYTFTPKQDRLAVFHARASHNVGRPASEFYAPVQDYLRRQQWDDWATLGYQGIADFVVRLDEGDNLKLLRTALEKLPAPAFEGFASVLEHEVIGVELAEVLQKRLAKALAAAEPDLQEVVAGIRALSCSSAEGIRKPLLMQILSLPIGEHVEVLAAIASRCWHDLRDGQLVYAYLEALAKNAVGQQAFNQLVADLMFIPGLRTGFLDAFRNPERSTALSTAIGGMFRTQLD